MQHIYKPSPTGESLYYAWFPAMHTRVDIAFYGTRTEEEWTGVAKEVQAEIHHLEQTGNCFDPASELGGVNRIAHIRPLPISEELFHILALCKEYHTRTQGCFDISVHSEGHTPDTMHQVHLSPENRTIHFTRPGIRLNLSGFLKGYALDKIRTLLQSRQVHHALINLGNSSILAMGNHPLGEGWKLEAGITLHDQCLTTSGNDTETRTHIINPRTGIPVAGKRQIKVITENGAMGEAYSTALFACPDEQRTALPEALDGLIWSNSSSL